MTDQSRDFTMLDEIAKNAPGLVYQLRVDNDGTWSFPYIGDAVYDRFGYSPDVVQRDISVFRTALHPDDREKVRRVIDRSREELSPAALRVRIRSADGTVRWIETHATPVQTPDGGALWTGLAVDVTTAVRNEENLNRIFRSAPFGVIEILPDGTIVEINEYALELLGYPRSRLLGTPLSRYTDPTDSRLAVELNRRLAEARANDPDPFHLDARFVQPNGVSLSLRAEGTILRTLGGSVDRIILTLFRLEDAGTQESIRRRMRLGDTLRAMIDGISEVFAIVSPEGVVEFTSGNVEQVFGWSAEEMIGRPGLELIHPDDRDRIGGYLREISLSPDRRIVTRARYLHRDGAYRWVELTAANRLSDPVLNGIIVKHRDITEQRRLEEENEERRLYLEGILKNAPDAIVTLDTSHRVVEWNPGAIELFGYTPEETVGKNLDDLVAGGDENDRRQAAQYTSMVLQRQTLEHTEAVRYRKDGTPVSVILAGAPIVMGDTLVGLVATYKDITRQKRAEERAGALLKENTLMLKEMRHRIRNDLGLVSSLLSLQAGQSSATGATEALDEARSRVDTIARVYDRLDPDAGAGRVNIDLLLAGVVADLGDGSKADGITATYRGLPDSVDPIHLDTRRSVALGIIVNELVTNAKKYAFDRSRPITDGTIIVAARIVGTRFEVTVRDNGVGVAESVLTGETRGYGFTVIETLLHQHGGAMEIVRDVGTVVTVDVPID
ncbi:MAG: PAS domain-containing sensor histidine kinase [Alkalispirochaeta sp.]